MSVVMGVFHTIEGAEDTTRALLDAGFTDDDIGLVVRDTQKGTVISDDLGREYASGATPRDTTVISRSTVWDRFPERYDEHMRREGLPADAMPRYQQCLNRGDVIMVVNAHDRTDDALRMIEGHGGEQYCEQRKQAAPRETTEQEYRLPVVDEEVIVEKRRHEVGEVRVREEKSSKSVDIPTTVTHEQIHVERRKLDRPVTPEEYRGRQTSKEEVCMPIVDEEIQVTKRPVIREELIITRVPVTEQKTIRETVTHTEPHVEKTGKVEHREKRRRDEAA